MEGTEEIISELEEITQPEQHREKKAGKIKNRVSGPYGTKIKYLAFISLESQERRNRTGLEQY